MNKKMYKSYIHSSKMRTWAWTHTEMCWISMRDVLDVLANIHIWSLTSKRGKYFYTTGNELRIHERLQWCDATGGRWSAVSMMCWCCRLPPLESSSRPRHRSVTPQFHLNSFAWSAAHIFFFTTIQSLTQQVHHHNPTRSSSGERHPSRLLPSRAQWVPKTDVPLSDSDDADGGGGSVELWRKHSVWVINTKRQRGTYMNVTHKPQDGSGSHALTRVLMHNP